MDDKTYFDKIGTVSTSLYDLALGHKNTYERYTDMEPIGVGAIKKIHRVLDLTSGRPIALASPKEDLSKEQIQYFLEEARLTASLEHPSIIPVYDLGFNQQGLPYFTMKLCSSQKLSDLLLNSESNLFQLLEIFLKVCDAVAYAHSIGAVHRDLKPENILLGNFGEVLVCDWGSAQIIPGSTLEHELGQLSKPLTKGTPGYMSPEQVAGEVITIPQDIYSLGALLYCLLTKEMPTENKIKRPSEIKDDIPSGLDAICLKAMLINPTNRYQQTTELITDLKAWRSGFSPMAENASFLRQIKLLIIRNKTLSSTVFVSFIVISFISWFYISSLKEKEHQTSIQRNRAEKALTLYDIEKESRQKIAAMGADYFIMQANQLVSAQTKKIAEELLASIPTSDLNKKQKQAINAIYGRIFFYRQQFHKALHYLKDAKGFDSPFLLSVAQEFITRKESDKDMLSTSSTVEILGRLNAYSIHQAHCFYRDLVLRIPNYTEQEKLIEKMILVNNEWMSKVNIKLTVKDKKYHLDLSNNPLMRVWVPIREMPLTSLNISNCSKLNDAFSVLYNMPLEELNVSNSKIKKYAFLTKLKGLKRLIISHHDVQKPSLKKYAGDIKIIIQD